MKYLGGKFSIADEIAMIIKLNRNGRDVLEPFCGACWVTSAISKVDSAATIYASDIMPDLIMMWQAVQQGWLPPSDVSEEEYRILKYSESSALRAFVGFACSFGAKFFGGYARNIDNYNYNYAQSGIISIWGKKRSLQNVKYSNKSFDEWQPNNMIIYCDPPYEGTTGYKGTAKFDHEYFWQTMREWSKNNTVLISSYEAPNDFNTVWMRSKNIDLGLANKKVKHIEKLFSLNHIVLPLTLF